MYTLIRDMFFGPLVNKLHNCVVLYGGLIKIPFLLIVKKTDILKSINCKNKIPHCFPFLFYLCQIERCKTIYQFETKFVYICLFRFIFHPKCVIVIEIAFLQDKYKAFLYSIFNQYTSKQHIIQLTYSKTIYIQFLMLCFGIFRLLCLC